MSLLQQLPIDTASELLRLGGWGVLMLATLVWIWAGFRSEPFWYTRAYTVQMQTERDIFRAERNEERERCVTERQKAESWQSKYEGLLTQQIVEMKDRDRTIEILARERGH